MAKGAAAGQTAGEREGTLIVIGGHEDKDGTGAGAQEMEKELAER